MDDRLRMHKHLDLFRRHIKQPSCLDDFQSFIGQRGGIDGDFFPHFPVRMVKSLFHRHMLKIFSCLTPERSAGSSQQDLLCRVAVFSVQRLEDRAMFRVHRVNPDMML